MGAQLAGGLDESRAHGCVRGALLGRGDRPTIDGFRAELGRLASNDQNESAGAQMSILSASFSAGRKNQSLRRTAGDRVTSV